MALYLHTLRVRVRRHRRGHTRHPGDAAAVIRACIEACWNGRTFTASPGHFDMFWTRDLGFSTPSLVRLGEGERVRMSLACALGVWTRRRSHVTTTINYGDHPADGVCRDVVDLLSSEAVTDAVILLHDTANAHVRAGLAAADLVGHPKVRMLDLAFVELQRPTAG